MITDLAKSYARTVVPLVVGGLVAWALHHGHDIHGYEGLVTVIVTAAYYGLARLLELYVAPQFGWLLGFASSPAYAPAAPLKATQADFATKMAAAKKSDAGSTLLEVVVIFTLVLVVLLIVGIIH